MRPHHVSLSRALATWPAHLHLQSLILIKMSGSRQVVSSLLELKHLSISVPVSPNIFLSICARIFFSIFFKRFQVLDAYFMIRAMHCIKNFLRERENVGCWSYLSSFSKLLHAISNLLGISFSLLPSIVTRLPSMCNCSHFPEDHCLPWWWLVCLPSPWSLFCLVLVLLCCFDSSSHTSSFVAPPVFLHIYCLCHHCRVKHCGFVP